MEGSTCDVCGQPATVHSTEIRDGMTAERHLCAEHTDQEGLFGPLGPQGVVYSSVEAAVALGIVNNLRGTVNFIRRRGRLPSSVEELQEGMALHDDFTAVQIEDADLRRRLECLDGLIRFFQRHGRLPRTPEEVSSLPWDSQ
jgi:hypothetical protein